MNAIPAHIAAIERPSSKLWPYYFCVAVLTGVGFPVTVIVLYFKYHTMRYRFDGEGIRMSWGILFRQETVVNYARIQDIHLTSNFIERWLGIARIVVQTASGSSMGNLTLEGLTNCEEMRDFLYSRMRGAKEVHAHPASEQGLAEILTQIAGEVRALREAVEKKRDV